MYVEHPLVRPGVVEARAYQVNIARTCIERSTMVVLPTGMGKTIVALLVIADILHNGRGKVLL
ncbi:MAG: DEAD/DEAH box helicase family protein, partial [Thermoplasmata archaeon]|nr:DEAD/DEAH box helicase family protein [Thermoplasmata archaeon]NIS13959.1 DEAD/DEAH box helicase family protein [Thermoplasmata archaeon]NIS21796.1 DEAD/DEAH box helicase family protein [Thermoplasmata archaeon]NIT79400.1 DEAD/DEAH box helicase family protein [Thermoplasmata archaeon]NIU50829.1 DEAD/DEAH box helicase family protein [Thermoplasmata archaeon]